MSISVPLWIPVPAALPLFPASTLELRSRPLSGRLPWSCPPDMPLMLGKFQSGVKGGGRRKVRRNSMHTTSLSRAGLKQTPSPRFRLRCFGSSTSHERCLSLIVSQQILSFCLRMLRRRSCCFRQNRWLWGSSRASCEGEGAVSIGPRGWGEYRPRSPPVHHRSRKRETSPSRRVEDAFQ